MSPCDNCMACDDKGTALPVDGVLQMVCPRCKTSFRRLQLHEISLDDLTTKQRNHFDLWRFCV